MMILMPLLINGCAITSGDYCDISRIIWWENSNELMETPVGIKRQVVEHNSIYERLCK